MVSELRSRIRRGDFGRVRELVTRAGGSCGNSAAMVALVLLSLVGCEPSAPLEPASTKLAPASLPSSQPSTLASTLASNDSEPVWVAEFESPTGVWRLRYRPIPAPIARNELFEIDVELVSSDPNIRITSVDARMPEHLHGMTLRPELHDLGGGRYRVEGMLFHMAGFWELFFWVEHGASGAEQQKVTKRVRFAVVLE